MDFGIYSIMVISIFIVTVLVGEAEARSKRKPKQTEVKQ